MIFIQRKRLGQHFLFEDWILQRIVDYAELSSDDVVLEVGPGLGTLTFKLAEKAGKVVAVEKDLNLYKKLKQYLSKTEIDNVELLYGDIFKVKVPSFNKVVSNLPYYISRRFTVWMLKFEFQRGVLLLQREYADKLVAEPGSKGYSWISMIVQCFAQPSLKEVIPKNLFKPPPKVDSRIVVITPKYKGKILNEDFETFSLKLFSYKNKKLKGAFKSLNEGESIDFIETYFKSLEERNVPLEIRVRQLSPEMVEKLFKIWNEVKSR